MGDKAELKPVFIIKQVNPDSYTPSPLLSYILEKDRIGTQEANPAPGTEEEKEKLKDEEVVKEIEAMADVETADVQTVYIEPSSPQPTSPTVLSYILEKDRNDNLEIERKAKEKAKLGIAVAGEKRKPKLKDETKDIEAFTPDYLSKLATLIVKDIEERRLLEGQSSKGYLEVKEATAKCGFCEKSVPNSIPMDCGHVYHANCWRDICLETDCPSTIKCPLCYTPPCGSPISLQIVTPPDQCKSIQVGVSNSEDGTSYKAGNYSKHVIKLGIKKNKRLPHGVEYTAKAIFLNGIDKTNQVMEGEFAPPSQDVMSPNSQCGICSQRIEGKKRASTVRKLPCSHRFHATCMNEWTQKLATKKHARCPTCNSIFPVDDSEAIVAETPKRKKRENSSSALVIPRDVPPAIEDLTHFASGGLLGYIPFYTTNCERLVDTLKSKMIKIERQMLGLVQPLTFDPQISTWATNLKEVLRHLSTKWSPETTRELGYYELQVLVKIQEILMAENNCEATSSIFISPMLAHELGKKDAYVSPAGGQIPNHGALVIIPNLLQCTDRESDDVAAFYKSAPSVHVQNYSNPDPFAKADPKDFRLAVTKYSKASNDCWFQKLIICVLALEAIYHPASTIKRYKEGVNWRKFSSIVIPNELFGFHCYGTQAFVEQRQHIDCKGLKRIEQALQKQPITAENEQRYLPFMHQEVMYSVFFIHDEIPMLRTNTNLRPHRNDVIVFCNEPHGGLAYKQDQRANRTYAGLHGDYASLVTTTKVDTQEWYFPSPAL